MSRLVALLLLALAPVGCNVLGYQAQWVQNEYPGTRLDDALDVAVETVDRNYDIEKVDHDAYKVESKWSDAPISAFERHSTRARVFVELKGGQGQPVLIRVRVEREVCKATSVYREHEGEDDWESYPDDREEADRLMSQMHMVLHEFGASPALKARIQHAQDAAAGKSSP
jgi:hypothetical protein